MRPSSQRTKSVKPIEKVRRLIEDTIAKILYGSSLYNKTSLKNNVNSRDIFYRTKASMRGTIWNNKNEPESSSKVLIEYPRRSRRVQQPENSHKRLRRTMNKKASGVHMILKRGQRPIDVQRNILKHTSRHIEQTSIVHYCKRVLCWTETKHILRLNERPYGQEVNGIEKEYRS